MRRYKGNSSLANAAERTEEQSLDIKVRLQVKDVNLFTRIMEGYEHVVTLIPIDPQNGLIRLRPSPQLAGDVLAVLYRLPLSVDILSVKVAPPETSF